MVEQRALPVLQGWYARLRREGDIPGACQVATHIAFVCGGILEWGGELPTTPHGEIAGDRGEIDLAAASARAAGRCDWSRAAPAAFSRVSAVLPPQLLQPQRLKKMKGGAFGHAFTLNSI